jgi:hypothetical protein
MTYLKYTPISDNLWAVIRAGKIGEIALDPKEKTFRFIPVETYAYTLEEMGSITGFMQRERERLITIYPGNERVPICAKPGRARH